MAINYVAVLVAAVASFMAGFIWYHPKVFGTMWMSLSGVSEEKKGGMAGKMVVGLIAQLVMAYVLAMLVGMMNATTLMTGAMTGFWAWLGFIATVTLGGVLWKDEPVKLWVLNAAHWLVALIIMGGILAVWV